MWEKLVKTLDNLISYFWISSIASYAKSRGSAVWAG